MHINNISINISTHTCLIRLNSQPLQSSQSIYSTTICILELLFNVLHYVMVKIMSCGFMHCVLLIVLLWYIIYSI